MPVEPLTRDLRQPLAAIVAYAASATSLLRRSPPAAAEALEVIRRIADQASRADDMLRLRDAAAKPEVD
jgi:C4-dicarboxylate-specific signal transduction histidine kinase